MNWEDIVEADARTVHSSLCQKTAACLSASLNELICCHGEGFLHRGKVDCVIQGRAQGWDLTDGTIWAWKEPKHVAKWLHSVNFVPLEPPWEAA